MLAIAAGAPVVPTLVYGAREVMPKGSFRIRSGFVDVHFLEPVATTAMDYDQRSDLMSTAWHRIADAMWRLYGVGTSEASIAAAGERVE